MQVWQASQDLQPMFAGIDQLVGQNLRRVQSAMQRHRIGPHHFSGSTGYGHGDLGREAYDEVQSSLKTVIAKHTSQKSGKKGHCHCVTMCICDFAPCISPLTRQHPPCQTCNIMSVCMNITTAHGLALFHMSYAQAVDSCCDVQTLCAQQATCMLDLTGSKLSFALPTAKQHIHLTLSHSSGSSTIGKAASGKKLVTMSLQFTKNEDSTNLRLLSHMHSIVTASFMHSSTVTVGQHIGTATWVGGFACKPL